MWRLVVLLGASAVSAPALAGGRVAIGISFGFPLFYYPPPPPPAYYYYPAPVVVSSPPARYVERREIPSTDWSYYCEQSKGYYPQVKTCPGGWRKVSPSRPE